MVRRNERFELAGQTINFGRLSRSRDETVWTNDNRRDLVQPKPLLHILITIGDDQ